MTYIFNDPIHGTIELDPVLVKIIDTPEFQRLRNIKQTGVVVFVYPGATHSRFEHSIGVCYLSGQMIDKLSTQTDITPVDKLCVQIAGLLHDIGHGPFSHLFDDCFIQQDTNHNWSHELQSCKIFDHILEKYSDIKKSLQTAGLKDTDFTFVKEMIHSKEYKIVQNGVWPFKGRPKEKSFLYEIVANERTGIDVDKFDYLLRDCYHLGVNCTVDWRRLVHMMKVVKIDGECRLALRDKERDNVFNLFYLRMHLRRIAYQHPTCSAIEFMIKDVFTLCNSEIHPHIPLSDSILNMDFYLSLTDYILDMITNLNVWSSNESPKLKQAQNIIRRINSRKLYPLVGETPPSSSNFKDTASILNEIVGNGYNEAELKESLVISFLHLNFGKWGSTGDPLETVLFYNKNGNVVTDKKYYKESSLFTPISWSHKQLRIFCRSEDPRIIAQAKGFCQEWISREFTD